MAALDSAVACYADQRQTDGWRTTSHEQQAAEATQTAKMKLSQVAESAISLYGTAAELAMHHVCLV